MSEPTATKFEPGLPARVIVSPDVHMQEVAGEAVLLDLQGEHYYGLNDIGTRVWTLASAQTPTASIVEQLLSEFEVDRATLIGDLADLLDHLRSEGLIRFDETQADARDD